MAVLEGNGSEPFHFVTFPYYLLPPKNPEGKAKGKVKREDVRSKNPERFLIVFIGTFYDLSIIRRRGGRRKPSASVLFGR